MRASPQPQARIPIKRNQCHPKSPTPKQKIPSPSGGGLGWGRPPNPRQQKMAENGKPPRSKNSLNPRPSETYPRNPGTTSR